MSKAQALKPKYNVGETVAYVDRHDRMQTGTVRHIEGKWTQWGSAYLIYTITHPTYRNGRIYCGEDVIQRGQQ
jgi:hypothetical protein